MTRRLPASALKHLREGSAVTLITVWNGKPNQAGIHGLKPGPVAIDVAYGDYGEARQPSPSSASIGGADHPPGFRPAPRLLPIPRKGRLIRGARSAQPRRKVLLPTRIIGWERLM